LAAIIYNNNNGGLFGGTLNGAINNFGPTISVSGSPENVIALKDAVSTSVTIDVAPDAPYSSYDGTSMGES
jgi:hypothetical protein